MRPSLSSYTLSKSLGTRQVLAKEATGSGLAQGAQKQALQTCQGVVTIARPLKTQVAISSVDSLPIRKES